MALVLHHIPGSRSLRVRWLLEELALDYRLVRLGFSRDDLRNESYLGKNPLGRVPTLEDGECVVFESGAIVAYLLERYGDGRLEPAVGHPDRGRYLSWLHWAEASAMPPVSDYLAHRFVRPEPRRIAGVAEDAQRGMRRCWGVVEAALSNSPFIGGPEFSAADIMLGVALKLASTVGAVGPDFPGVEAYLARLEERPAFQRAAAD